MTVTFPLSIRNIAPHPDAARLTGTNMDGLPSGVHTGGAWLLNDEVWKPLDGRPFLNADFHVPTQEVEVLELMKGSYGFPDNWRVEDVNGRRFIVRPYCAILGEHVTYKEILGDNWDILKIEESVRLLNKKEWEVSESLDLAYDAERKELFLFDLSNAHPQKGTGAFEANEQWRINKLFAAAGLPHMAKLRSNAKYVISSVNFLLKHHGKNLRHVYASYTCHLYDGIAGAFYIQNNADGVIPCTWIVTPKPLTRDQIKDYSLIWGWSPIHGR